MAEAEMKVEFVSNLNGTTLAEVSLGSFLGPLCLLSRGLFLITFHLSKGILPLGTATHLLMDFTMLIVPLVLSCTVLSGGLYLVIAGLAVADLSVLIFLYWNQKLSPRRPFWSSLDSFMHTHVESNFVPFVTVFRVLINIKTAISILAVDFSVFPRRYAKTESYGTGVMDFGVGAFVMANALVCPEARGKEARGSQFKHLVKQVLSVWPLVLLGILRMVSLKSSGYHEHVTEYGVHWNFFFTLALVRFVASALLSVFPVRSSWLLALLLSGVYQVILETTDLKDFIIHSQERHSFLQANREGIFSVVGYVAIYMAGVQVGDYLMQKRTLVKDWIHVIRNLLLGSLALWGLLFVCQTYIEPVSRRMANLSFCIWTVAQSLFFLSCLSLADIVLLFAKVVSNSPFVSSSWNPANVFQTEGRIRIKLHEVCLIQSVSRNQLLFFLFSNLMTGLINVVVDTLKSSDFYAVCILLMYMFMNSLAIFILHINNITIKFW